MKLALTLLLLIPTFAFCQTHKQAKRLTKYLVQEAIISEKETEKVNKDSLIHSLYDVFLDRYHLKRGEQRGLFMYYTYGDTNTQIKKLIDALYRYEVIEESIHRDLVQKLKNSEQESVLASESVRNEIDIFQYLYELAQKEAHIKNGKLAEYLKGLQQIDIIPSEGLDVTSIRTQEALISLIKRKLIIHRDSLPETVETSYRYAFEALAKLSPDLSITDFAFAIQETTYDDFTYKSAVVTFKCNGVPYVSHNSYDEDYENSDLYDKLDGHFFKIFNKVLTDIGSPDRIVAVGRSVPEKINLILTTKDQYNFLGETGHGMGFFFNRFTYFDPYWYTLETPKYWNPFNLLNQNEMSRYFMVYDSLGLFSHLSHKAKQQHLAKMKEGFLYSYEEILYEAEGICMGFDWEMFDGNQPYKHAIEEFAAITRGEFTPTDIHDDFSFDKPKASIGFKFNKKIYTREVPVMGDWYDYGFLELIYKAIEENQLSGKFYDLPDGGQVSAHIYLTPAQYTYLTENNLLEFYSKED